MALANFTNFTNADNYYEQMVVLNDQVTGGWFGLAIFLPLAIIIFAVVKARYDNVTAFILTSFSMSVLGTMLYYLSLVSEVIMFTTWIMCAGAIVLSITGLIKN